MRKYRSSVRHKRYWICFESLACGHIVMAVPPFEWISKHYTSIISLGPVHSLDRNAKMMLPAVSDSQRALPFTSLNQFLVLSKPQVST